MTAPEDHAWKEMQLPKPAATTQVREVSSLKEAEPPWYRL